MAAVAFFGFDFCNSVVGSGGGSGNPSFHWTKMSKQNGLYTTYGFPTLDPGLAGYEIPGANSPFNTGVESNTGSYGAPSAYKNTNITSGNRTSVNTQKGYQCTMLRSAFSLGDEFWMSMDICHSLSATSYTSAYSSTADHHQIFKFGDVSVRIKSATWNSGTSLWDIVVSIHNVSTEVATVSYSQNSSNWSFFKIHVKLHASTGLIDVTIDGVAQSASYTGQNTVSTTAAASATGVAFGPPAMDNATNLLIGWMDNVYFDDAGFTSGRPTARRLPLASENSSSGWSAWGTSATTVHDALTSDVAGTSPNAKSAKGTGAGAEWVADVTAPTTSDLDNDVIGFQVSVSGLHNRNHADCRRLAVGISLSGTHNMGAITSAINPILLNHTTPPHTSGRIHSMEQIWEKPAAAGPYDKTDITNIKVRLLVS